MKDQEIKMLNDELGQKELQKENLDEMNKENLQLIGEL